MFIIQNFWYKCEILEFKKGQSGNLVLYYMSDYVEILKFSVTLREIICNVLDVR